MLPEVLFLAERITHVVEDISQDVKSICLSMKEVNYSMFNMAKRKHCASVSAPGMADDNNKETFPEKEVEEHPGFPHVLERLVMAVESLPHEVKSISLTLRDINDNMSQLRKQEESTPEHIISGIDDYGNEEECPMERADETLVKDDSDIVSRMESTLASSEDGTEYFKENPCGENHSSQDSVHEGNVLVLKKRSTKEVFGGVAAYGNTGPLLFHDYVKSSYATDVSEPDPQSTNEEKIQQVPNKPKSSFKKGDRLFKIKPFPVAQSSSKQVKNFEDSTTSEECSVAEKEGGGSALKSLEDTTTEGDYLSSSVTESLQHLGDANEGPSGCSEENAYFRENVNLSEEPEKTFKCSVCPKTFHERDDLYSHLPTHCRKTLFKCRVCKKAFTLKKHLYSHMKKHTNENLTKSSESSNVLITDVGPISSNSFQCKQCEGSFSSIDALSQHVSTHSHEKFLQGSKYEGTVSAEDKSNTNKPTDEQEKPYLCEHCGTGFDEKRHLDNHSRKHTGEKPFECKFCHKNFTYRGSLSWHIRSHTGEKPYTCDECGKSYSRKNALTRHIRLHTGERPFKCNVCLSAFPTKGELSRHMVTHTDVRPYTCTKCNADFKHMNHLYNHQRQVHEKLWRSQVKEKIAPFLCDHCGKSYKSKTNLVLHVRTHTGEKPYKCSVCHKSFANATNRLAHMRLHTGEEPYRCRECGKAYKSASVLLYHKQTAHSTDRPYKCHLCAKAFICNYRLNKHMLVHTTVRPYACTECKSAFKDKSNLTTHKRLAH